MHHPCYGGRNPVQISPLHRKGLREVPGGATQCRRQFHAPPNDHGRDQSTDETLETISLLAFRTDQHSQELHQAEAHILLSSQHQTNGEAREMVFVESTDPYHKPKTTNWQGPLPLPPCLLWITTSTRRNKNKKSNSLAYYERPPWTGSPSTQLHRHSDAISLSGTV